MTDEAAVCSKCGSPLIPDRSNALSCPNPHWTFNAQMNGALGFDTRTVVQHDAPTGFRAIGAGDSAHGGERAVVAKIDDATKTTVGHHVQDSDGPHTASADIDLAGRTRVTLRSGAHIARGHGMP